MCFPFSWVYAEEWNCWVIWCFFIFEKLPVFHSSHTILRSHQHRLCFPFFQVCIFLVIAILVSMKWYYIVVLTCIFLMINDVEHFLGASVPFIYLLYRNIYSIILHIFKLSYLTCSCWVLILICLDVSFFQIHYLQMFSHILFTSLIGFFNAQFIILMKSNLSAFSFVACTYGSVCKTPLPNSRLRAFTPMLF